MVKLCVCYQVKCVTVCFHFLKKSYNITACCARAFKVRDMLLDSQLSATYTLYSVPHKKTGRNLLFFLPLPLCCVVDPTLNSRIQFEAKRRFPSDARGGGGTEVNNVYAVLRWSMNSNLGINFPSDIDFRGKCRVVNGGSFCIVTPHICERGMTEGEPGPSSFPKQKVRKMCYFIYRYIFVPAQTQYRSHKNFVYLSPCYEENCSLRSSDFIYFCYTFPCLV